MPRKKPIPKHVVLRNGQWYVRKRFPGLKEAIIRVCKDHSQAGVDDVLAQMEASLALPPTLPQTVNEMFDEFLASKIDHVSKRTYRDYTEYLDRYFREPLGEIEANSLSEEDIRKVLDSLRDRGLSTRTRNFAFTIFKMAVSRSVDREMIPKNPAKHIKSPKIKRNEMVVFDEDEAKAFYSACDKFEEGIIFQFALESGARPEEYLALQRSDLNMKKHTVTINRALVFHRGGNGWSFEPTKTAKSRRTLKLSEGLFIKLKAHIDLIDEKIALLKAQDNKPSFPKGEPTTTREKRKEREARMRLEAIGNQKKNNLLFPNSQYTPFNVGNLGRRDFADIKKAMNAKRGITIKSLRHTCATLLLLKGVNIKVVSERLGHASITITLETYSHVLPTMQDQASDAIAEMLH